MMDSTHQLYLTLLADHIWGRKTVVQPDLVDWVRLQYIIRIQSMSGIAYVQLRDALSGMPEHALFLSDLRNRFAAEVFYAVCRKEDFSALEAVLTAHQIAFLPVKGSVLSQYYPVWQLRTMGDVDFLIHTEDRARVDELMRDLGYTFFSDTEAVWSYDRDVNHYEIHDHIFYEPMANDFDYQGYFDGAWEYARSLPGVTRFEVDESFHFLYLIAHTAKHILHKGSGFRPFVDMALMVQKVGERMRWDWITSELERLRLLKFAETCSALCERWFGIGFPIQTGKLSEEFFECVTQKAFLDGVFGFQNPENAVASSTKGVHTVKKNSYYASALTMTVRHFFPSYQNMREIEWYSFLDGRPWLLPAAWIYRFYYCLRYKFAHSQKILKDPYVNRKQIEIRETFIDNWGL
ncbi:MAG: nucleotidyltransferase family protein [Oscillospiraceae bacterium]|nr:nucleotidyltransferase family protein [Oscillospiraceae bacterium]